MANNEENMIKNIDLQRLNLFKNDNLKLNEIIIQNIELDDETIYFLTIFFSIFFKKSDQYLGIFDAEAIRKFKNKINPRGEYIYLGTRSRTKSIYILSDFLVPLNFKTRMLIKLLFLIVDFISVENEDRNRLELYISRRYQYNVLVQDAITGAISLEEATYAASALGGNFIGNPNNNYENITNVQTFYNYIGAHNVNVLNDILDQYNTRIGILGSRIPTNLRNLGQNINLTNNRLVTELNTNLQQQSEQVRQRQTQSQLQLPRRPIETNINVRTSTMTNENNIVNPAKFIFDNILDGNVNNDLIDSYANELILQNLIDLKYNYSANEFISIIKGLTQYYNLSKNNVSKKKYADAINQIKFNLEINNYRVNLFEVDNTLFVEVKSEEEILEEQNLENERIIIEEERLNEERQKEIETLYTNVDGLITVENIRYPERLYEENLLAALLIVRENVLKNYPDENDVSNIVGSVMNNLNNRIAEISNFVNEQAILAAYHAGSADDINTVRYRYVKNIIIGTLFSVVIGYVASYFYSNIVETSPVDEKNVAAITDKLYYAKKTGELAIFYSENPSELIRDIRNVSDKIPDIEFGMQTNLESWVSYLGYKTLSFTAALITTELVLKVTGKLSQLTNIPGTWLYNPYPLSTEITGIVLTYFVYDAWFSYDGSLKEIAKATITGSNITLNAISGGSKAFVATAEAAAGLFNTVAESTVQVGNKITTLSEEAGGNFIKYGGQLVLVIAGVSLAYIIYKYYSENEEKTYNLKIINEEKQ